MKYCLMSLITKQVGIALEVSPMTIFRDEVKSEAGGAHSIGIKVKIHQEEHMNIPT